MQALTLDDLIMLRRVFRARWIPEHVKHARNSNRIDVELDEVGAAQQCIMIIADELFQEDRELGPLFVFLFQDVEVTELTQEQLHEYITLRLDALINQTKG